MSRSQSAGAAPLPELAHLEMLARVDELITRLTRWTDQETPWEPLQSTRTLVRRLLGRLDSLRIRLEAPLVVATFGGTGTGKSALVNALVGQDCTDSGRERPTTRQPILLAHPRTDLELLGLPTGELRIVRCDSPLLRDIVLIDCPDPDTTESETHGSNLERLHRLLPYCDVLLYTTTQQKYRSARVGEELLQAASGCRLVFVQTCAALDVDIRDDWRRQLHERFEVPEMFFVDSLQALREQQSGSGVERKSGDFGRLVELLQVQLSASQRGGIRRANLIDLVAAALTHCRERVSESLPALARLEQALADERVRLAAGFSQQFGNELLASRSLWEQRMLTAVTRSWGLSPFAWVLRAWQGLGGLVTSAAMFRARSAAQWAVLGTVEGARRLRAWQQERQAEDRLEGLGALVVDETALRESQIVVAGFVQEARLDPQLVTPVSLESLGREVARVEEQFVSDAGRRVDETIARLAAANSRPLIRWGYELAFVTLLAYIVGWSGYNFLYAYPIRHEPLIGSDFYIHSGVFLLLWSSLLVMLFTRRLRRGLRREAAKLAQELAGQRLGCGLFPELEAVCRDARRDCERLESLEQTTLEMRRNLAGSTPLGGTKSGGRATSESSRLLQPAK